MSNRPKARPQRQPGVTALWDQMTAAQNQTADGFVAMSILNGAAAKPQSGFVHYELSSGPSRLMLDEFMRRDDAQALIWCRHLRPDAPQPAFWQAWRPGHLYCAQCLAGLPPLSGKEDRRCDACSHIGPAITPMSMMGTARRLPQREGKPAEARPPVVLMFGLCKRCELMSREDAAQLSDRLPVSLQLNLPGAGRLTTHEADAYRHAIAAAKCLADRDTTAIEAFPAFDSGAMLWGLAYMTIALVESVISQSEWHPEAGPMTVPEVLTLISGGATRWASHPVIKFPADAAAAVRKAAAVTERAWRHDPEAFTLPADEIAETIAGGVWLLDAMTHLPVYSGLTARSAQVWDAMAQAVRHREDSDDDPALP